LEAWRIEKGGDATPPAPVTPNAAPVVDTGVSETPVKPVNPKPRRPKTVAPAPEAALDTLNGRKLAKVKTRTGEEFGIWPDRLTAPEVGHRYEGRGG
jgi:hypothetical protein